MIRILQHWTLVLGFVMILAIAPVCAAEGKKNAFLKSFAPLEGHGFIELRGGTRTQDDPNAKDISVMETRLQADLYTYTDWAEFKFKGDVWADGVTEKGDGDVREAWFSRSAARS
jgi:hypothetical protein